MLIALSLSGCLGASTASAEGFNPHAGNVSDACVFSFEGACEVSLKIPLTNQLGNFFGKTEEIRMWTFYDEQTWNYKWEKKWWAHCKEWRVDRVSWGSFRIQKEPADFSSTGSHIYIEKDVRIYRFVELHCTIRHTVGIYWHTNWHTKPKTKVFQNE